MSLIFLYTIYTIRIVNAEDLSLAFARFHAKLLILGSVPNFL